MTCNRCCRVVSFVPCFVPSTVVVFIHCVVACLTDESVCVRCSNASLPRNLRCTPHPVCVRLSWLRSSIVSCQRLFQWYICTTAVQNCPLTDVALINVLMLFSLFFVLFFVFVFLLLRSFVALLLFVVVVCWVFLLPVFFSPGLSATNEWPLSFLAPRSFVGT